MPTSNHKKYSVSLLVGCASKKDAVKSGAEKSVVKKQQTKEVIKEESNKEYEKNEKTTSESKSTYRICGESVGNFVVDSGYEIAIDEPWVIKEKCEGAEDFMKSTKIRDGLYSNLVIENKNFKKDGLVEVNFNLFTDSSKVYKERKEEMKKSRIDSLKGNLEFVKNSKNNSDIDVEGSYDEKMFHVTYSYVEELSANMVNFKYIKHIQLDDGFIEVKFGNTSKSKEEAENIRKKYKEQLDKITSSIKVSNKKIKSETIKCDIGEFELVTPEDFYKKQTVY